MPRRLTSGFLLNARSVLNPLKTLFKQTAIYGAATVLPRVLSVVLVRLYTTVFENASGYGEYVKIYAWIAIFNVVLAYGMETAFFRFYNERKHKANVVSTALLSLMGTSLLFLMFSLLVRNDISTFTNINADFIGYAAAILVLDALVIIPFAMLRANGKPMRYAVLKIINVAVNLGLNLFFLLALPKLASTEENALWDSLYRADFEIPYIFISNIVASGLTLLFFLPTYLSTKYRFDTNLWKSMLKYAGPILVAGIAFTINEVVDKIFLANMVSDEVAGIYGACYKLALFMTLFGTAFRMGVEPFFFSHAKSENPQKTYAQITNYFVILGSIILLVVVVFVELLAQLLLGSPTYFQALNIVPIVLLASFCLGIYHNLSVWYKITDRTKFGAYISSIGAILTIIINLALIPVLGYMASAFATLAAYGSMMCLSYYFGKRYYPIPYNMRKIAFYGGISILFSVLSFYVFDSNLVIGCGMLLVFLGLIYKMEGDKLKNIFLKRGN